MNAVCANLLTQLGLDDSEVKKLRLILDRFDKLKASDATGRYARILDDIIEIRKHGLLTAEIAIADTYSRLQDFNKNKPIDLQITLLDAFIAPLYAGKTNPFYNLLDSIQGKDPQSRFGASKNVYKFIRDNAQSVNPMYVAAGNEAYISEPMNNAYIRLREDYSPIFTTGSLATPVEYKGHTINHMDQLMLHAIYDAWDGGIERLLAPDIKAKKYRVVSEDEIRKTVEAALSGIDEPIAKDIAVTSTTAWYGQLNRTALIYQRRGTFLQWNPQYRMPNYHDKLSMFTDIFLPLHEEKMPIDKIYETAYDQLAERLMKHGDPIKTLGQERYNKIVKDAQGEQTLIDEEVYKRYRQIAQSLIDAAHKERIDDQFSQSDDLAFNVSSINKRFTQRSYYFSNAEEHWQYMKDTNSQYRLENAGAFLMSRFMKDASTLAQDATVLQFFGSNPAFTVNKLITQYDPKVMGENYVPKANIVDSTAPDTKMLSSVFGAITSGKNVRNDTIKSVLFGHSTPLLLPIPRETQKRIIELQKSYRKTGDSNLRQSLSVFMGEDAPLLNTATEFELSALNFVRSLPQEVIRPTLHVANRILDPFVSTVNVSDIMMGNFLAKNPHSKTAHIMHVHFKNFFQGMTQDDENIGKQMRSLVATMAGMKESELTDKALTDMVNALGLGTQYMRILDTGLALNKQSQTMNPAVTTIRKIGESKIARALGAGSMEQTNFINEFMTGMHVYESVKHIYQRDAQGLLQFNQPTPLLKTYMDMFRMNDVSLRLLDAALQVRHTAKLEDINFKNGHILDDLFIDDDKQIKALNDLLSQDGLQPIVDRLNDTLLALQEQYRVQQKTLYGEDKTIEEIDAELVKNTQAMVIEALKRVVSETAFSYKSFLEKIKDDARYMGHDTSDTALAMLSDSPSHRLIYSTFWYLKQFITQFTTVEARHYANLYKSQGAFQGAMAVTGRASMQLLIFGALGMTYNTYQGLLTNQSQGFIGVAQDLMDPELSETQKTFRFIGHVQRGVQTGIPTLSLVSNALDLTGRSDMKDALMSILATPAVNMYLGGVDNTLNTVAKIGSDNPETMNKQLMKDINSSFKSVPLANLAVPKIIYNYGATPFMQHALEIASASEKFEAEVEGIEDANIFENIVTKNTTARPLVPGSE